MFKRGFVLELFGFIFYFFLSVMILLAFGLKFHTILSKKHTGKIEYKFQDTLEFCDKDTNEVVKRLDNVEFRVLDKNRYMYVVKTPDLPSPEVLIMNEFPPNTYLRFYQTPAGE